MTVSVSFYQSVSVQNLEKKASILEPVNRERRARAPSAKDQVFISYSHEDTKWREDLEKHLKPYLRAGSIKSWYDNRSAPARRGLRRSRQH
jgi:internalin A